MSFKLGSSIKFKLLTIVILVFLCSFSGILFSVITILHDISSDMEARITDTMNKTSERSDRVLNDMAVSVDNILTGLQDKTVADFSKRSTQDLSQMEERIKMSLERMLEEEARAITDLLKSVAPAIIVSEEFNDLVKYSKAASKTKFILYALFVDETGSPYPGYIDPTDPQVRSFLNSGKGQTGIEKLLEASSKSENVFINREPIEYYGKPLGSIVICISRQGIEHELDLMSGMFQEQIRELESQIRSVLSEQSGEVIAHIRKNISSVTQESIKGMKEAGVIIGEALASEKKEILFKTGMLSLAAIVLSILIIGVLISRMLKPLSRCADFAEEIGSGNLKAVMTFTSSDEIGVTAEAMGSMAEKLRVLMAKLSETTGTISNSSEKLSDISVKLAESSSRMQALSDDTTRETGNTADNIKNISSSSEEINSQIDAIALTSTNVSKSVTDVGEKIKRVSGETTSVSSAIEEMYASLNEVANNSGKGASITDKASDQAAVTSSIVNELGKSANDIEKVVSLISGIASQTNLLALNAAIEAAGAGEAGKGFAVVANEVKELAKQTSGATLEIREEIERMQTNTRNAVDAIASIVEVINQINSIMGTIASAVEEQTATINEISKSISSTAGSAEELTVHADDTVQAVSEIASSIDQVAKGSELIAKDVSMASSATENVLSFATQTNKAVAASAMGIKEISTQAEDLSSLSRELKKIISNFKI
ncbi:MAG: methyl-accepting chemotaxis protein [Desulfobacteraceae bacterium]